MFDKDTTASFDVDAQNTFTPLCPDELPVPDGHNIVAALNAQAAYARIRVGSKDAHSHRAVWVANDGFPQFSPVEGHPEVDIRWNRHAEPGTKGFELIDGLPKPIDYDFFVWKGIELDLHPYGACYHNLDWRGPLRRSTGVIEYLRCQGIKTVIVGGLALDYCVKNTALQLADAGFHVIVNLAACRGIGAITIEHALCEFAAAGVDYVEDIDRFDDPLEEASHALICGTDE